MFAPRVNIQPRFPNTNESCGYAPESGVFGGAEESAKVRRFGWLAPMGLTHAERRKRPPPRWEPKAEAVPPRGGRHEGPQPLRSVPDALHQSLTLMASGAP